MGVAVGARAAPSLCTPPPPNRPTRCIDCFQTTKDFVPCAYDERTLITVFNKLYHYALTLTQTGRKRSIIERDSQSRAEDIEMLTSSPSPTLHASTSSSSLRGSIYSQSSQHGTYWYTNAPSPQSFIRRPPPAAFPGHSSPTAPSRPSVSGSTCSSKTTVDAGTQYTPPSKTINTSQSLGKRPMVSVPPSPDLAPQMPQKRTAAASPPPTSHPIEPTTSAQAKSKPITKSSPAASASSTSSSSAKRARGPTPRSKPMPSAYENCDVRDLVVIISNMLMELIRLNDQIPLRDGGLTRFHSRAPPGISVQDYLQRLATHATLSPPILLSMVYYIDRLCALYPAFNISSLTVHRFLIASATVASKGLSDSFWTNNTYARCGGVSLKELALLELEFLWRVEWKIVPKPEVLCDYYRSLVERSEGYEIIDDDEKARRRQRRRQRKEKRERGSTGSSGSSSSRSDGSSREMDTGEPKEAKGKG